jgi:hypothetical protein
MIAASSSESSPSSSSLSPSSSCAGAPNAFAEDAPPNVVAEPGGAAKLDKLLLPSGRGPPNPPTPPSVPPRLEPPKPPNPDEPSPPKPDDVLAAKGDVAPKPPEDPKPPGVCSADASDPKPPDTLAELLLNVEKGDFSRVENAERPDDAKAEVEVAGFSACFSMAFPNDASAARGDLDLENVAKGEAAAVFAKPELGSTYRWDSVRRLNGRWAGPLLLDSKGQHTS